ncbi:MAG: hypothetical protein NHB15_01860 [Methanosarcina barkeri]|nr:hypothetical protein [Methanosarcina sp. ERenArc_MAG2]
MVLRDFYKNVGIKTLNEGVNMVKCSICGKDENSLLRVKHRRLGIIKLCFECWEVESGNKNLLPSCGGCDCCK